MNSRALRLVSLACLSWTAACGSSSDAAPPASDVPASFHLATAPPKASSVADVIASAKDGEAVVVTGRVGGDRKVFVDGLAAFTIVDLALEPCGEGRMDDCKTPWDYCCDAPDVMAKNQLSVELVADGKLVQANPRGFHGLDVMKTVVVQGEVARDAAGNVRVLTRGLHVAQ